MPHRKKEGSSSPRYSEKQHALLPLDGSSQGNATKRSRIPEQTIAFVQTAFASDTPDNLDTRERRFLAHVLANPQLTLQELASVAEIRTREGARRIWKTSLSALWLASPPELQARYPMSTLTVRKRGRYGRRGPPSPETRAKLRAAQIGRKLSPETRARMRQAQTGKRHSAKTRAQMTASQRTRWKFRKQRLAA